MPRPGLRRERVEHAPSAARLGLRGSEGVIAGDLDDRREDDLAAIRERVRRFEERAVPLRVGDRDDDLHGRLPSSTSGTTRSASTLDHASARARERRRAAGWSSTCSTASAIASPVASAPT